MPDYTAKEEQVIRYLHKHFTNRKLSIYSDNVKIPGRQYIIIIG
jgi:hypothetical protein